MLDHDEEITADMAQEIRIANLYHKTLLHHPHCSDPDHPGCADCEEEE